MKSRNMVRLSRFFEGGLELTRRSKVSCVHGGVRRGNASVTFRICGAALTLRDRPREARQGDRHGERPPQHLDPWVLNDPPVSGQSASTKHNAPPTTLSADVLDSIDEIVALGVPVNPACNGYGDNDLRPGQRRR